MRLFISNNRLSNDAQYPCPVLELVRKHKLFVSLRTTDLSVMDSSTRLQLFNFVNSYESKYWTLQQLDNVFDIPIEQLPSNMFNVYDTVTVKSFYDGYKSGDTQYEDQLRIATSHDEVEIKYNLPLTNRLGVISNEITEDYYNDYFTNIKQSDYVSDASVDVNESILSDVNVDTNDGISFTFNVDVLANHTDTVVQNYVPNIVISCAVKLTPRDSCTDFTNGGGIGVLYELDRKENFLNEVSNDVLYGCSAGKKRKYLAGIDDVSITMVDDWLTLNGYALPSTPVKHLSTYNRTTVQVMEDITTNTVTYNEPYFEYHTQNKPKRLFGSFDLKYSITKIHGKKGHGSAYATSVYFNEGTCTVDSLAMFQYVRDVRFNVVKYGNFLQIIPEEKSEPTPTQCVNYDAMLPYMSFLSLVGSKLIVKKGILGQPASSWSYAVGNVMIDSWNAINFHEQDMTTTINVPRVCDLTVQNGSIQTELYKSKYSSFNHTWDAPIYIQNGDQTYLPVSYPLDDGLVTAPAGGFDTSYTTTVDYSPLNVELLTVLSNAGTYSRINDGVYAVKGDKRRFGAYVEYPYTVFTSYDGGGVYTDSDYTYLERDWFPAWNVSDYPASPDGDYKTNNTTFSNGMSGVKYDKDSYIDEQLYVMMEEIRNNPEPKYKDFYLMCHYMFSNYAVVDAYFNCMTFTEFLSKVGMLSNGEDVFEYRLTSQNEKAVDSWMTDLGRGRADWEARQTVWFAHIERDSYNDKAQYVIPTGEQTQWLPISY